MAKEIMDEPYLEFYFFECSDLITTSAGNGNDLEAEHPLA